MKKIMNLISLWPDLILALKKQIKLIAFQSEWRKRNEHNGTVACNLFPVTKITVGKGTYGGIRYLTFDNESEHLYIGNYCSIAADFTFIAGGEHNYKCAFLYPVYTHIGHYPPFGSTPTKGPIVVEDDVWIGYGATILSGCRIGRGSVIGAGSVVSRDVPPYSIYAGNKVIKSRFDSERIKNALSEINMEVLCEMSQDELRYICGNELSDENIDDIREMLR